MHRLVVLAVTLSVAGACGKNQDPPPPTSGVPNAARESSPGQGWLATAPSADQNAAQQARNTYDTICTMCHGPDGRGAGKAASMLKVKPRDYTDATWQASVTDADLEKTILLGGAGVGKSPEMPAQPQLEKQPEVLHALVAIIRGFKK